MSLVLAYIHVEAEVVCCATTRNRQVYDYCLKSMVMPPKLCAIYGSCKVVDGSECPPEYPNDILKNSGDIVNEYCKLGCASFGCGALTLSRTMNSAVRQCTNACSTLSTKGSKTALESA